MEKERYFNNLENKRKSVLDRFKNMIRDQELSEFRAFQTKTAEGHNRWTKSKLIGVNGSLPPPNNKLNMTEDSYHSSHGDCSSHKSSTRCCRLSRVYSQKKIIADRLNNHDQFSSSLRYEKIENMYKQKEDKNLENYLATVDKIMINMKKKQEIINEEINKSKLKRDHYFQSVKENIKKLQNEKGETNRKLLDTIKERTEHAAQLRRDHFCSSAPNIKELDRRQIAVKIKAQNLK